MNIKLFSGFHSTNRKEEHCNLVWSIRRLGYLSSNRFGRLSSPFNFEKGAKTVPKGCTPKGHQPVHITLYVVELTCLSNISLYKVTVDLIWILIWRYCGYRYWKIDKSHNQLLLPISCCVEASWTWFVCVTAVCTLYCSGLLDSLEASGDDVAYVGPSSRLLGALFRLITFAAYSCL